MPKLQEKMEEYRANGVRLGWLIDPQQQQVEIYRWAQDVEVLRSPMTLSGENVLPIPISLISCNPLRLTSLLIGFLQC
jgi:Uma2 family endonuclease